MTGPIQREIETLLQAAFPDGQVRVVNDSAAHHGHSGDDGSGESHFTVSVVDASFADLGRLARQRTVLEVLGDIPGQRVHALAVKARAPGE